MSEKKGYQLLCHFHLHHMAFVGAQKKVEGHCTFLCDTGPNLQIMFSYDDFVYVKDDETMLQYTVNYIFLIYLKLTCMDEIGWLKKYRIKRCNLCFFATLVSVISSLCNVLITVWIPASSVHQCNKFGLSPVESLVIFILNQLDTEYTLL